MLGRFLRTLAFLFLGGLAPVLAQTTSPPAAGAPPVAVPRAAVPGTQLPASQAPALPLSTPPPPAIQATTAVLSGPLGPVRSGLESARAELEQTEAALRRDTLTATDLQSLRTRIDPVAERLTEAVSDLSPQLADAKARLDQLGPKPKDGVAPDGADVARDRSEREGVVAAYDDTQRLARALLLQAEQLTSQISDRRRASFARALFERSYSPLAPDVWLGVARAYPRDLRSLGVVAGDTAARFESRLTLPTLTLLAVAVGLVIALQLSRRQIAPRLVHRDRAAVDVPRRRRVLTAVGVLLVEAVPAAAGSFLLYQLLAGLDVLPPRMMPVVGAALAGLAFMAFVRAAIDALMAPDRSSWRLMEVSDATADRTMTFLVAFATVLTIGKIVDAANQAIAASLPLAVLSRAVSAFLCALILAELLRRFSRTADQNEACLGPYIPTEPEVGGPVRMLGWALVAAVIGAVATGYIAFGAFLVDQIAWTACLAALVHLGLAAADELIAGNLRGESRVMTTLQSNLGVRRRSLEQLGVLGTGLVRVVLVVVGAMLALAPWGVESGDLMANLRAAFFGFKVGDVSISLSTTMAAILVFAGVLGVTRIVQRWLDGTFLPTTDLDSGLRNSIGTAIGYLGFFAAAAIALSYVGLGLERIAIVAGALSVGIGFGLQSIVNNFVSGLILLWERPIRVGDLVVIGDGEGYVRRISVRATEIETFDRSAVIIPNSNLISGVVRNRVRGDRTGRVIVPVNVLRNQDPARAAQLLVDQASRHPDVLSEPPPRVTFKKIGDTFLEFDLVCFVEDVTKQVRVQSDLNFAVFGTLVEAGVIPPLGPGAMTVGGLEQVQAALQHIADAIATAERRIPSDAARPASPPSSEPRPRTAAS